MSLLPVRCPSPWLGSFSEIAYLTNLAMKTNGKNHDIECDPSELDEYLKRLDGALGASAETRELFEKRCARGITGKVDGY
jgi:hypothetical protein